MAHLNAQHLALITTRRSSPIFALGSTVLLIYISGIGIYLWAANYSCRLRDFGDSPPISLSRSSQDIEQRGRYLVITNYIRAAIRPEAHDAMTFVAAATFPELINVPEICRRWQGPMSIAVYAPGSDFKLSIRKIIQLRLSDSCVHQNISWHMFYDKDYGSPVDQLRSPEEEAELISSTQSTETWLKSTFKSHGGLPFPANLGRNVAIQESLTEYVLISDLHYYPSSHIIPRFLKLLEFQGPTGKRVYVLPMFKMAGYNKPPETKSELVQMVAGGEIILPTGTSDCSQCNIFPNARKWLEARSPDDVLSVHYVSREKDEFESWQPYYIASREIPLFDEDQVKEGRHDRKLQLLELCLQHYEFHILDNAFLVQIRHDEEPAQDINMLQNFVHHNNKARERKLEALLCRYGSETGCSL